MVVVVWRRLDVEGLERLELTPGPAGLSVSGTVLTLESGGLLLRHRWDLDPDWRTRAVSVERDGPGGRRSLRLERAGAGWRLDGADRPDFDGAEEPDLSLTPFCNSLAIRGLGPSTGATRVLDVAFIDGATLSVTRSRQSYRRLAPDRVLYRDLGVADGFEAELELEPDGIVRHYAGLFTRVTG